MEGNMTRLRVVCGSRSPNTINTRADSLLKFCKWYKTYTNGWHPVPLTANGVADYVWEKHQDKVPYTQLSSFLEAVNFAVHVLGLPTQPQGETLITPFIKSVMDKASLNRPRRKQARPLTTNEVVFLEETLKNPGKDIRDRFAVGAFLFALYSRSRWSDLRNVDSYMLDVDYSEQRVSGFLEFRTSTHKTAAQTARHGLPMPLVAPLWGLTSPPWGLAFKRVADEARLEFDSDFRGPMLPAPKMDGSWVWEPPHRMKPPNGF